jgi:hypothetical protein
MSRALECTDLLSSHGLDAQSQVTKDIHNAIQMLVAVLYTQHRLRVQLMWAGCSLLLMSSQCRANGLEAGS